MSRPGEEITLLGMRARRKPGRDFENIAFHTVSSLGRFHMDGIILLPPRNTSSDKTVNYTVCQCICTYSFFFLHACYLPACITQTSFIIKRIIGFFALCTHIHVSAESQVVYNYHGNSQLSHHKLSDGTTGMDPPLIVPACE